MSNDKRDDRSKMFRLLFGTSSTGYPFEAARSRAPYGGSRAQRLRRVLRRALWFSRRRQEEGKGDTDA
ncbi:MAG TPA: hypothetical protein ENI37_09135 [Chloroflexi bacterium]|nr:hypothetical protein [Chloroflexota bacterium]